MGSAAAVGATGNVRGRHGQSHIPPGPLSGVNHRKSLFSRVANFQAVQKSATMVRLGKSRLKKESPVACDPKSFFDQSTTVSNDLTRFAYFDVLSNQQYENLKQTNQLGAVIPIYGVPINFNMSQDQAKQTMQVLREAKQINYTEQHQKTILTSVLSQNGLAGYKACVAALGGVGTFLWMDQNSVISDHFFIGVKWNGGVGGHAGEFNFVGATPFQVIGGTVVGAYKAHPPRHIQSGQEIAVEVTRDLSKDFQFTASVNGNAPEDKIYLPKYQPRPVHYEVRNSETVTSSSSVGGADNDDKRMEFKVRGDNERFLPVTAKMVGHVDGNHNEIQILDAEPMRIMWRVWAQRANDQQGAWAQGHVSVISISW